MAPGANSYGYVNHDSAHKPKDPAWDVGEEEEEPSEGIAVIESSEINDDLFSICWWNCAGGILSKFDYIKDFLKTNPIKPTILFIAEADKREHQLSLIQIEGYSIITALTLAEGKSRVIGYINNSITNFKQIKISDPFVDIVGIDVSGYRFIGVYKGFKTPGNETLSSYFEKYMKELNKITKTERKVLIGGDFNVNLNHDTANKKDLDEWSTRTGLSQLITMNTQRRLVNLTMNETRIEESLIDHVYSNILLTKINQLGSI